MATELINDRRIVTIRRKLGSAVVDGGTLTVDYPTGYVVTDFDEAGRHFISSAMLGQQSSEDGDFSVSFGSSSATITNASGASWPTGLECVVELDLRGNTETPLAIEDGGTGLRRLSEISPAHFGAIGDGIADDTAAVLLAAAHPGLVDWGNKTYRVTSAISFTQTANTRWRANGATILYDGTAGIEAAVKIMVGSAGVVRIEGALTIDANAKAYTGLWIEQSGSLPMAVDLAGVSIVDPRRSAQDHDGGGGIRIVGRISSATLTNPKVSNATLATGAGIVGVDGVCGINIRCSSHADGRNPANVTIINPDVRGVYSEDATYIADQDGIIMWTERDATTEPVETSFTCVGGYFENCWGRAIKVQTERADVTGIKIRRYTGSSTSPTNPDIDLQVGGGNVRGVDCIYDGYTPYSVVGFACPTDLAKESPNGFASGLQINVLGGATLPFAVSNSARDFSGQVLRYKDISVRGSIGAVVRFNADNSGTGFYLFAENIDAAPTTALIQTGTGLGSGRAVLTNCVNTGSTVALSDVVSVNFIPLISQQDCFGWTTDNSMTTTLQSFTRLGVVVSNDDTTGGGFRVSSKVMADGDTWVLPRRAVATNFSTMFMVSISLSRNGQALIAGDNGACAILAQASTEFVAGGATEPVSGNWRVWSNSTSPRITNRSGSSRTVTVFQFG